MGQYYFVAQLPSLDGLSDNAPLPISQERFFALCEQYLGKKTRAAVESITLMPPREPEKTSCAFLASWNTFERSLRLALAKARAEILKKPFAAQDGALPHESVAAASAAVQMTDPLEAERYLLKYRLQFLETLRPMDAFSEAYILYFGLKLKLLSRIQAFDTARGQAAYQTIYRSVLHGETSEASV